MSLGRWFCWSSSRRVRHPTPGTINEPINQLLILIKIQRNRAAPLPAGLLRDRDSHRRRFCCSHRRCVGPISAGGRILNRPGRWSLDYRPENSPAGSFRPLDRWPGFRMH